ncbi:TonB-dependent receptor [Chryseolinea sp. H1M3-3]|uniref:TonB-dependent receptor n=1 Tax=Chryseolinea sp. H1M3-3 TaxID=3034144 RepID=UPI0023EAEACD|nr:TonB-dependent receptor [Chryseolinea sp. H1M3-3]
MFLRYITLLIVAVFFIISSPGQDCNGTFTGRVLDEANRPLIGAAIVLENIQTGTVTNDSGEFVFLKICSGTYKVNIQYLGYKPFEFEIKIEGAVSKVIHLTEDVHQLQTVIVEDELMHTEEAHNLAKLDAKQLAESAGKSLGESLKDIPGVNSIQTGPGIFKPVIHGVHSQRVLILNHGIRQEGQQWGAEHAPEIDPFIASNIVIIKDASSIKYGTDALGGVIVVNPAPLPESGGIGGTFNTIFQSNGRSGTASGMIEGGLKKHDGWGWRLQGTAKRTGDFQTSSYALTNTAIKEMDFSAALGYHKNSLGIEGFFSHFQSEIGILKGTSISSLEDLEAAMERDIPQYTGDFSYTISEPRQKVSHNLAKIIAHVGTERGELNVQYGFQNNNRAEYDIRRGGLSNLPSIDLQLNTHTLEAEWETLASKGKTFCFGLTGMLQNNRNIPGTQRIPFIPNFNSASGGLFVITKLNFNKWTIDAGIRYDYRKYSVNGYDFKNSLFDAAIDFNNVSGTLGATVELKSNQALHMNISSAWRPPHVVELYSLGTHQSAAAIEYGLLLNDSTNEVMNIHDVSFKNEQALKWVATYQKKWTSFQMEVGPYVNYIFNYIYLRPKGVTQNIRGVYPYYRYTQTDALFLGLDVSGSWKASRSVTVTPKISLLHASDVSNNDYLVFIPSNWYELAIRYDRPVLGSFKNFYIESKTKYVSRQHRAPRVVTVKEINDAQENGTDPLEGSSDNFDFMRSPEGYLLWNVSTGITIKREKTQYDFRLGSENLLNASYREYTNRFRYYADDLGRNFILSIKCIF